MVDGALQLVQTDPTVGPAVPDFDDANLAQAETDDRCASIRPLIANFDAAGGPDVVAAGGVLVYRWLDAMPPAMRAKVLMATDDDIRSHLAGRASISGVVDFSEAAITDYVNATRRRPAEPECEHADELALAI